MTDSRFRRLLLCFMTIWTVALGQTGNYSVVRGKGWRELLDIL